MIGVVGSEKPYNRTTHVLKGLYGFHGFHGFHGFTGYLVIQRVGVTLDKVAHCSHL